MGSVKQSCEGLRKGSNRSKPAEGFLLLDLEKTLHTISLLTRKFGMVIQAVGKLMTRGQSTRNRMHSCINLRS
jgi:hypothetical protein